MLRGNLISFMFGHILWVFPHPIERMTILSTFTKLNKSEISFIQLFFYQIDDFNSVDCRLDKEKGS